MKTFAKIAWHVLMIAFAVFLVIAVYNQFFR